MSGPRRPTRPNGFTLIEAMASVVILSTLGSIATFILVDAVTGFQKAVTAAQLHTELAIGLDRISREVRRIPLDPDAGGDVPNITDFVDTTQLTWEGAASELAHVLIAGGNVSLRAVGGTSQLLLEDVTTFDIACYDQNNNDLGATLSPPDTDDIRRVEFTITLTREGVSQTLRTKVFLRSLMEGAG